MSRGLGDVYKRQIAYWERKPLKWDPKAWAFKEGGGDPKWLDRERRDGFALPTL